MKKNSRVTKVLKEICPKRNGEFGEGQEKKKKLKNYGNLSNIRSSKGITLVALMVTIIVIIILASISIGSISGKNGILQMAGDSKISASVADAEETANLIYINLLKEFDEPNLDDVVTQMENEGYEKKIIIDGGTGITGFSLDKDSIEILKSGSGYVQVQYQISGSYKYYIKTSDNRFHEIKMDENTDEITIDKNGEDLNDNANIENRKLEATVDNKGIQADITGTKIKITDTANQATTATMTVTYGEYKQTCKIHVKNRIHIDQIVTESDITFDSDHDTTKWTNEDIKVSASTENTEYVLQVKQPDGTWRDATKTENGQIVDQLFDENGTMTVRFSDGTENGKEITKNITNIDKENPSTDAPTVTNVTTNSITVKCNQKDTLSGLDNDKYEYSKDGGKTWEKGTSNTYTFENLTQETDYPIKTRVTDRAGNTTISNQYSLNTGNVTNLNYDQATKTGNVTFTPEPANWTKDSVRVTATVSNTVDMTGFTLQTSTDGNKWINTGEQVVNINNTPVYARLSDGTNASKSVATFNVTNIDKINPSKATITAKVGTEDYIDGTWLNKSVIIRANATDGLSGVDYYEYSTSNTATTGTKMENGSFIINSDTTNTYYVRAVDMVGNAGDWSDGLQIKRDTTVPTVNISGGTGLKANNQNLTISGTDNNGITGYYFGTSSTGGTYNTVTSNTSWSITQNVNSSGIYYLFVKDAAGNINSTSIEMVNYTVNNLLETISGTQGTYTNSNYASAGSYNYIVKKDTSLSMSNIYNVPTGSNSDLFVGASTNYGTEVANLSTSSLNVTNGATYYMWFNRNTYTVTISRPSNGTIRAERVTQGGSTTVSSSTGTLNVKYGDSVRATATADSGYEFTGWSGGYISGTSNPRTGTAITSSKTISASFDISDNTAPSITINSTTTSTIRFTATDYGSQVVAYAITTSSYQPSSGWYTIASRTSYTTTETGLTHNTTYYIWARDGSGNVGYTRTSTDRIPTLTSSNITFTYSPSSQTTGSVSVTARVSSSVDMTGLTLQTRKGSYGSWGTTNPMTFTENGIMYVRLTDGTNTVQGTATANVTNIYKQLQVGDYVDYNPTGSSSYSSANLVSSNTGSSSNSTLYRSDLNWRVLYIDSYSGSATLVGDATSFSVYLQNPQGYNNGVYILNNVCSSLYSNSSLGVTARSINLTDFENCMSSSGRSRRSSYSDAISYNSQKTYSNEGKNTGTPVSYKDQGMYGDESSDLHSSPIYTTYSWESSLTVRQTYYTFPSLSSSYFTSSAAASVLSQSSQYWLSTRFVRAISDYAEFGIRCVNDSGLYGRTMIDSEGGTNGVGNPVRPVVTLTRSLQSRLTSGSGTRNNPYSFN